MPALLPTMSWLDSLAPNPPAQLKATNNLSNIYLTWEKPSPATDGDTARYYVIYRRPKGMAIKPENPAHILTIHASPITAYIDETAQPGKRYTYAVTAVDRLHNESRLSRATSNKRGKNIL